MRKIIQYFNNVKFIKILILNSLISILLSYPYMISRFISAGPIFGGEPLVSDRRLSVIIQIFIIVIICFANYILYKLSKKHNLTQTINKATIIKMLIVLALIIILIELFSTIPELFLAIFGFIF